MEVTRQESVTPDADNNKETDTMFSVLKDLDSLKSFQKTVEKNSDLEQALISNQTTPSNNSVGDENGTSGFISNILKNRITNLENEISKKDAIIDHLMSQLLLSKNAPHNDNSDSKNNDDFNNKRKSSYTYQDSAKEKWKKIDITGDSMLNGIHECGLSKQQQAKMQNFPGGTSETILDEVDTLVADKPDCIIVHAGMNDIAKGIDSLNSVKKN